MEINLKIGLIAVIMNPVDSPGILRQEIWNGPSSGRGEMEASLCESFCQQNSWNVVTHGITEQNLTKQDPVWYSCFCILLVFVFWVLLDKNLSDSRKERYVSVEVHGICSSLVFWCCQSTSLFGSSNSPWKPFMENQEEQAATNPKNNPTNSTALLKKFHYFYTRTKQKNHQKQKISR